MSKFKIYTSCADLPLNLFIRCIVDSDLQALVIKGNPPQEEILEAWGNLWSEYLDLNEDNEAMYILNLQRDIVLLRYHVTEIDSIIVLLRQLYHQGLVDVLKERGYIQELNYNNPQAYQEDLDNIQNSLSSDKLQLEMKESELAEYVRNRSNETIDRTYFTKMLIHLSKFMGFQQRAKDITVAEFVTMIKEMYSEYKSKSKVQSDGDEG